MCIPSLSQIQDRINKIFNGKDGMELEAWQLEGVEWEDEHFAQVRELKAKGCKNIKKKKKNKGFDIETFKCEREDGTKYYMKK